ncbi:MAG: tRNA-dihydrouridine synthase family protein, partial [Victivallaceae bacterium]
VGSEPEWIVKAVNIINNYDFDVLDFNLGCPVAKVVKKNAGAQLGRQINLAAERLKLICEHAKFPVTAKIRIPDWDNYDLTAELCEKLIAAGANCITIHGRVREAFYSGPVNFEFIRRIRATEQVQIVGNGGVMGLSTYHEMRRQSGATEIMLARGAMGNPWLFEMIQRDLRGEDFVAPALEEFLEEIYRHMSEMAACYGELRGLTIGRKVLLDYLRGRGFGGEAKNQAVHVNTLDDLKNFLTFLRRVMVEHPIYTGDDRGLRLA